MDAENTELVEELRAMGLDSVADMWSSAVGIYRPTGRIIQVDFKGKKVIHGCTKETEEATSRI